MDPVKKLINIIDASLQDNSLDILNEYLPSLNNLHEVLNAKVILELTTILKRNGVHDEKALHVLCVLTCLQHFVNTVTDPKKWEKLSEDISKLCDLVFVISASYIKEECIIQRAVNVITDIVNNVNSVVDNVFKFSVKTLLASCLCKTHTKYTRYLIMILIGSLLQRSSRGIRTEILPSTIDHLNELSNFLCESENYETQVSVVEILARCLIFIKKQQHNSLFTSNPDIRKIYQKYHPFMNFDPDCRLFLNEVNGSLGNKQKVFSMPCMIVCADDRPLKKPNDPAYLHFWVDFNLESKSFSFYYQPSNSESWDLITVPQDKVLSAIARNSMCKSRSGETIEAVKFELIIDTSNLSPNSELPQKVKIYPRADQFMKFEPVIIKMFADNYKTEVVSCEKSKEELPESESRETSHKLNETCEEKSFMLTSISSKVPVDEGKNIDETINNSRTKSAENSEEEDEESVEGSPYSRFLKEIQLEANNVSNSSRVGEVAENVSTNTDKESALPEHNEAPAMENTNSKLAERIDCGAKVNILENLKSPSDRIKSFVKPLHSGLASVEESKHRNSSVSGNITKTDNLKRSKNTSETNICSNKKRLYCFERSNAEEIVLSSQDQELSVGIPSYKITKKETNVKPQRNLNREKVTFSYITNKEKEKSAIHHNQQQKTFDFEEAVKTLKPPSDDQNSENSSESSPHQLFKDTSSKPKVSSKFPSNKKKFFPNKINNEVELDKNGESSQHEKVFLSKSAYSDFGSSPERKKLLKCKKTYARSKPKHPWKRIRVLPVESSDSDSQYVPPTKLLKENNLQPSNQSPRNTRFAAQVQKDKIDPIRDNVFTHEMEVEPANDLEELPMKPREIVVESVKTQVKVPRKIPVQVAKGKTTTAAKTNAIKQNKSKNKKKLEPKRGKKDDLEKLSQDLRTCMGLVNYEPLEGDGPLDCEDLALDIFTGNDIQQKSLQQSNTFKVKDLTHFGRLLLKQVQEKIQKDQSLNQNEREMNLATFNYQVQAACNGLYKCSKNMASVTERVEKLRAILESTYNLQKDISAQINSEAMKIEEAKNQLMKNMNKIEKSESSGIVRTFREFGGYFKKLVLSFIQGNTTENAIAN